MTALRFEAVAATSAGRRRSNQDNYLVDRAHRLMVIADGIGGHQAGDIAAATTCATLESEVASGASLSEAVQRANREVRNERSRRRNDMGATLVALILADDHFELAWLGDSRAYLWDGQLKQLTRDHTLVESLYRRGKLTREEARSHPDRNVIHEGIGLHDPGALRLSTNMGSLSPGHTFLLCSDGVSDVLHEEAIVYILGLPMSAEARCMQLVSTAIGLGGHDNATAVLVEVSATAEVAEDVVPHIFWQFDPVTSSGMEPGVQDLPLVDVGLDSDRLSPDVTQVISIAAVERELAAQQADKPGLLDRLLKGDE